MTADNIIAVPTTCSVCLLPYEPRPYSPDRRVCSCRAAAPISAANEMMARSEAAGMSSRAMAMPEREDFARRCGTSYGHLRNVAYGHKPCSAELAINIDRESGGRVTCEELCQVADWAYVRGSRREQQEAA